MTPTDQTIVDPINGDCTRACLASILDLHIDAVPNFARHGENWFMVFDAFLHSLDHDYFGTGFPIGPDHPKGEILKDSTSVNGFVIATVPSRTFPDIGHSVVMSLTGLIVHDPNPNKLWQEVNALETKDLKHWMLIGPKEPNPKRPLTIRSFLESGGTLKFPYKKSLMDWYEDVELYKFRERFSILGSHINESFDDIDDALDHFESNFISERNIGCVLKRAMSKGLLTDEDLWAMESNRKTIRDQDTIDKINTVLENERIAMRKETSQ